jgi:hypothetical protein
MEKIWDETLTAARAILGTKFNLSNSPQGNETILSCGPEHANPYNPNYVYWDFEQNVPQWEPYRKLQANNPMWTWNKKAEKYLRSHCGAKKVVSVQWGYHESMHRNVDHSNKPIDVLFLGSITPRRYTVLQTLATKLNISVLNFGTFGPERDSACARAKVILNIHAYENQDQFEILRVLPLAANGHLVLSEKSSGVPEPLQQSVVFSPLSIMLEVLTSLLKDYHPDRNSIASFTRQHKMDLSNGYDFIVR